MVKFSNNCLMSIAFADLQQQIRGLFLKNHALFSGKVIRSFYKLGFYA